MKRRILLAGLAASLPLAARADPPQTMHKLGVIMSIAKDDPDAKPRLDAFLQGLVELGWQEGKNLHIEYRWTAARLDLYRQYALELVALAPDVILANGTGIVSVLKPLTQKIPIVCALVIDPVGMGLVESLARPRGNITGFTFITLELIVKWAALLKDAAPDTRRAVLLYNPRISPFYPAMLRQPGATLASTGVEIVPAPIETVEALRSTIDAEARIPGTGLIIGPDSFILSNVQTIVDRATANRLPSISVYRRFVTEGGLMTYGPDIPDIFRRSAGYVDRILRGANPADLPVQQPAKYEFIINQKTADTLGLTLPANLLARADEVIE